MQVSELFFQPTGDPRGIFSSEAVQADLAFTLTEQVIQFTHLYEGHFQYC